MSYTGHKVTAESVLTPITLIDARLQLRIDEPALDDDYITGLIWSQTSYVENQYSVALLTKTIEEYHDGFPGGSTEEIYLKIAPVASITSVKYIDSAGVEQTWDSSRYLKKTFKNGAFIIPAINYDWPTDLSVRPDAVKITYQAGFGDTPASLPPYIRLALLSMVGRAYTNREDPATNFRSYSDVLLQPLYRFL